MYYEIPGAARKADAFDRIREFREWGSPVNGTGGPDRFALAGDYEGWPAKPEEDCQREPSEDRKDSGTEMIVEADPCSLPAAAYVHSASWKESHRAFCSPEFIALHTPERQEAYLKRKMDSGSRIFMLVADAPVGIVSVTGSLIEDLYVLPERQRRGYGTALLEYAVGKCEGVPTLWILENNEGAARLYRRAGFRETGRRKTVTAGLDEIEFALIRPETDEHSGQAVFSPAFAGKTEG